MIRYRGVSLKRQHATLPREYRSRRPDDRILTHGVLFAPLAQDENIVREKMHLVLFSCVPLMLLLAGYIVNAQTPAGDASGGTLAMPNRVLASSSTTSCPSELEECYSDTTCSACITQDCVFEHVDGSFIDECDEFIDWLCCEYENESECLENDLMIELYGEVLKWKYTAFFVISRRTMQ